MARPTIKLTDFDPSQIIVIAYAITEQDLTNIYQYLRALQSHLELATWDDICIGGYYGTSALLHEVVELRILLNRDPYLLAQSDAKIKVFARLPNNRDAHVSGLEVEYAYLQRAIQYQFDVHINIGALLKVNAMHPQDWDDLFDTNLPFFAPSPQEISEAKRLLAELRSLGRRI